MARPRKYVQLNGREITGVSRTSDGRYYTITGSHRRYHKSLEEARGAYWAAQARTLTDVDRAKLNAKAEIRHAIALERLREQGGNGPSRADDAMMERVVERILVEGDPGWWQSLAVRNTLADELDVPAVEIDDGTAVSTLAVATQRLSTVLAEWARLKRAGNNGVDTRNIKEVSRIFNQFVKCVGNVPVNQLTSAQFRKWRELILKSAQKRSSGKWSNDRHAAVKRVFRFVRRHNSDWAWPDGLSDWLDAYDRKAYRPKPENKQPLPAGAFRSLLAGAERWAATDPAVFDAATQRGRGQRRQAQIKQHEGRQFRAILLLGANCGLDPVDFPRITRSNFTLDGSLPYLDLSRCKVEHRVGAPIERMTPLLPSTVEAVREVLDHAPADGAVFRSARGDAFATVTRIFRILAGEADVERRWSFKHLRIVGPTLAKRAKLSPDEREAFLGHVVKGTSRFYEGDVGEEYLVSLVNVIGAEYFAGEIVGGRAVLFHRPAAVNSGPASE